MIFFYMISRLALFDSQIELSKLKLEFNLRKSSDRLMEKKTQPCQEAQALLLFPLSRRLLANNNSRFFLKSCKRNKSKKAYVDVWNDFPSELPNEIALEILSKLPMKEVARLSLVSQKWRKVWQCYPILNFEDSRPTKRVGKKERHAFVSRVNRILDQHLGHSIDEFKVIFNLDSRSASDIDKWVAFACAKQVKRLELDFDTDSSGRYEKYTWPIQYQMPHNYHTWGHALASLSLKCVNITTETVECFLNSFPSLEILCISQTNVLTTIRACSLSLKHLEVTLCFGLNTIVLDAPKLLSFRYEGSTIKLHLNNVSSLSVVSLGTLARDYPIAYAFDPCLNYYAQLEYLELKMNLCGKMQLNQQIDHCPVLTNLKHLTLFCFTNHDQSLLGWTSLINASPVLQKLTLKLIIASFCRSYSRREIQKCDGHPLKCLKTLEIVGLEGYCVDLELAMYVLENAIMLEEVVIDTRSPFSEKDSKPDLMAQKRAMKLSSKLPQGAKLIFK